MEKVFEVTRQFMRKLFCDKCKDVEMQRHNAPTIAIGFNQTRYTYACPICKSKIVSQELYPSMFADVAEVILPNPPNENPQ